jgi:hypothetical protein
VELQELRVQREQVEHQAHKDLLATLLYGS